MLRLTFTCTRDPGSVSADCPLILRLLLGASFVPAAGARRWLLVAAGVWVSAHRSSGCRLGYPCLAQWRDSQPQ